MHGVGGQPASPPLARPTLTHSQPDWRQRLVQVFLPVLPLFDMLFCCELLAFLTLLARVFRDCVDLPSGVCFDCCVEEDAHTRVKSDRVTALLQFALTCVWVCVLGLRKRACLWRGARGRLCFSMPAEERERQGEGEGERGG